VPAATDLEGLGLDTGGHLLVDRALAALPPGDQLTVTGRHPALRIHLAAWCRAQGHRFDSGDPDRGDPLVITKGRAGQQRWHGAVRAGEAAGPPGRSADPRWGLAARGALVEEGGPPIGAEWADRDHVWADIAPKLYAAAAAAQWDPATAVECSGCSRRWTRAAAGASPSSGSRPARPPRSPRCTPATSCSALDILFARDAHGLTAEQEALLSRDWVRSSISAATSVSRPGVQHGGGTRPVRQPRVRLNGEPAS